MADAASEPLLGADDPAPFAVHNAQAASPWLLIADHAGQHVPARLADLGLPQYELDRHIGWDIGIAQVTRLLAEALDAFAIAQTYSRLVIDAADRQRPAAAHRCDLRAVSRTYRGRTGGACTAQSADSIGVDAQLHPGHGRKRAALACRRALPPRYAAGASPVAGAA
ncbi:N-formylglutamate amidohydrolase family protein [Xanthomonas citri pv. punicae str. LMG 859]|nr:N-formylglutamate amidohydrolase family protein [Xanthomonas citri pv. punicae str. LMG 859]